ncbi:Excinuclease ABC subunit A [Chitinispirillum alkaliphilum]|nr:Excinuclease ABC subunit A [Chitinispirillum alkaliphilum]
MKKRKSLPAAQNRITIEGASQNTLKNIDLEIPLNKLVVITGVSGSGKSSLAFDTIYAEGQRRYIETFSSYARQFLDRMDKPKVERITGIPPAIAIDQTNPVRTSRSTVGTMSEINDHLKLLFARTADLYCSGCGKQVKRETALSICDHLLEQENGMTGVAVLITFTVTVPSNFEESEVLEMLQARGYSRIHSKSKSGIEVIQDRVHLDAENRDRIIEDIEHALSHGKGKVAIYRIGDENAEPLRFSSGLHCADCDIHFNDPLPNHFSFNSPLGACERCRGFGRVIGVDYSQVIPDTSKTLAGGAIKPWQTDSYSECQDDLVRFARKRSVPLDIPWRELPEEHKRWVLEGEGSWEDGYWYGVSRFFEWLESKSYKMHIRVLLSRYRTYKLCPECDGARLKPQSLMWRLGKEKGYSIHEIMTLSLRECFEFFQGMEVDSGDEPVVIILKEINTRLGYLNDVGLGYLTLDRQSRTLSGGEVQRINLTTALGTSLVNTLFVLDEPSIGLHASDVGRLIKILEKLRDAGNSLIVVEHDPAIILSADHIIEMGPKPGLEGGEVVFSGALDKFIQCKRSDTAAFLSGKKKVSGEMHSSHVASREHIRVLGAHEHNLKNVDVSIPLGKLVCLTGVSGSGKSTLIDTLHNGWRSITGKSGDEKVACRKITGIKNIDDMVFVDQSPIGKTTRSNPASYVGALDYIRKLFASQPLSKERRYTAGTFSFNSGKGRCPTCSGNGFEQVEMQFLSDVYIKCEDCDGNRYRPEILEVTLPGEKGTRLSISDVLHMTVKEACGFFKNNAQIKARLQPLLDVGLSYLSLGQPVPTLSGGEAQRLKLAGHLTEKKRTKNNKGTLFVFDEPTTGLHFEDISRLIAALRSLIAAGNSVLVIEHNLDVISLADWIIDLGPGGGENGGEVVCVGTPETVMKSRSSLTGKALLSSKEIKPQLPLAKNLLSTEKDIAITNASEHNLKNIDVKIPKNAFTVITGVSGSGKSTVAFDILFAEGQRRYLESLNAYARQFVQPAARAEFDAVSDIPPTVAIEQRTSRGGRKSTVATVTEVYHYIRLLYVKLGVQHCPQCKIPIKPRSEESILSSIIKEEKDKRVEVFAPLVSNRKGIYKELASWANSNGFGFLKVDGKKISTTKWPSLDRYKEHNIDLPLGELNVAEKSYPELSSVVTRALELGKGTIKIEIKEGRKKRTAIYSVHRNCPDCGRGFQELDPRLFSFNSKHGWCTSCFGTGIEIKGFDEFQTGEEIWWNEWWDGENRNCKKCNGKRLSPQALSVLFQNRPISEIVELDIEHAAYFFRQLKLNSRETAISADIISELISRLDFLKSVGLGYLTLDRAVPTLSGGEAQRIRLASQLGSNLQGVCYILDEPTIGLHPRDNIMLLDTLFRLKDKGNTVVVVEHDEETIRRAEHLIDLGPGGGVAGGSLLSQGSLKTLLRNKKSETAKYLNKPILHREDRLRPCPANCDSLTISNANLHNLRNITVSLPLGRLVCVTGVSGSGKSTLVRDVLFDNLKQLLDKKKRGASGRLSGCKSITGYESIARVIEVDQSPIGKTSRSCPATYVGLWDDIRKLYAGTPEANLRGFSPSRFSFNVEGGRCSNCRGMGVKKVEMSFLPDVTVSCDVCRGKRFTSDTLEVRYKGKSIGDVLEMSIDEAAEFFSFHSSVSKTLNLLKDVGLGYLSLGQPSSALSGGEAQRIKLVSELSRSMPGSRFRKKGSSNSTLYILDEPTIGLHMADIDNLIHVLHRLVDAGNTVVVIEHDLDIIAEADRVIDLGPEGGDKGGQLVAQGTPWELPVRYKKSYTGQFLKRVLNSR